MRVIVRRWLASPATVVFGVALVAGSIALLWWGRDQVIRGDDLFYAQRLVERPLIEAMLYSNVYLIGVPLAVYKVLLEVFGLASDVPYRVAVVVLVATISVLFFSLARRRIGDTWAVAPALLLLFYGAGWEVLLTSTRLPGLFAVTAGLGAMLAIESGYRFRNALAAGLLTVAVSSHPFGLAFVVATAIILLARDGRKAARSAWVVLLPILVFGVWLLFFRSPDVAANPFAPNLDQLVTFAADSWYALTATATGLAEFLEAPVYLDSLARAAGVLVLLLSIGILVVERFRSPHLIAAWAALLTGLFLTRLSPGGFLSPPDTARYLYPEVVLFLLIGVEVVRALELRLPSRIRLVAPAAFTAVICAGIVSGIVSLDDTSKNLRATAETTRGQYSAFDLAGSAADEDYSPNPYVATIGVYRTATERYGEMGLTPEDLEGASAQTRTGADAALIGALGLNLRATRNAPPLAPAPEVVQQSLGVAQVSSANCLRLRPDPNIARTQPVRLRALVRVGSGGLLVMADPQRTWILMRRFSATLQPLKLPPRGHRMVLRIPRDGSRRAWQVLLASTFSVEVCGIAG